MNVYEEAIELLQARPETKRWPELTSAFERASKHRPVAWDFPVMACLAVGASEGRARTAVAAITCAHMSIILIDDLLDEDPRGAHHKIGVGRAANLAAALNALGTAVLMDSKDCPQPLVAAIILNTMIANTAYGQELDVQNTHTEEAYWAVTRSKSSPYFAAALQLGALFGGANLEITNGLGRFGEIFGEIMQIHDDLNDSLAVPANVDWAQGRAPLPLLFAELVDHSQRQRFMELRPQVADPDALAEAQAILVSSGAISYCVNELIQRQKLAERVLADIKLADSAPLYALLQQAIAPVKHLFTSVGADYEV